MLLDKVVIGSSIEAAYALVNECYFVPNRQIPPMFYRENPKTWPKLNIMIGLLSKLLSFEGTETLRIVENQLRIPASNKTYKYDFGKCFIFDPTGVNLENQIKDAKPKLSLL